MIYRVLIDGKEKRIKKDVQDSSRQADILMREEIINHYLDHEGARDVLILDAYEEEDS